jgi:hypothetical protein
MLSTLIPTWKALAEDEAKRAYTEQQVGDTSLAMHGVALTPVVRAPGSAAERDAARVLFRALRANILPERADGGRVGRARRRRARATWLLPADPHVVEPGPSRVDQSQPSSFNSTPV